jgi:predicted membrane channel-forming protein YqfA (hemolysin III family)
MFLTLFAKKAGEQAIGGIVSNELSLMSGLWRLSFSVNPIVSQTLVQLGLQNVYKKYETGEQRINIEGKEVYLREITFIPAASYLQTTVEIITNPVPVLAIGIGSLAIIGVVISLFLTLDKVEKILELPSTYLLIGLIALFVLIPAFRK